MTPCCQFCHSPNTGSHPSYQRSLPEHRTILKEFFGTSDTYTGICSNSSISWSRSSNLSGFRSVPRFAAGCLKSCIFHGIFPSMVPSSLHVDRHTTSRCVDCFLCNGGCRSMFNCTQDRHRPPWQRYILWEGFLFLHPRYLHKFVNAITAQHL